MGGDLKTAWRLSFSEEMRIRGVFYMIRAIQIDVFTFTFKLMSRWKRDNAGLRVIHRASDKPVLQFVSVQRKDSGEWALPGVRNSILNCC